MKITERIDEYLLNENTKDKVKIALDKYNFPYKSIDGNKKDISVVPNITDSQSKEWAKLETQLETIANKLAEHGIIAHDVVVTLSL